MRKWKEEDIKRSPHDKVKHTFKAVPY